MRGRLGDFGALHGPRELLRRFLLDCDLLSRHSDAGDLVFVIAQGDQIRPPGPYRTGFTRHLSDELGTHYWLPSQHTLHDFGALTVELRQGISRRLADVIGGSNATEFGKTLVHPQIAQLPVENAQPHRCSSEDRCKLVRVRARCRFAGAQGLLRQPFLGDFFDRQYDAHNLARSIAHWQVVHPPGADDAGPGCGHAVKLYAEHGLARQCAVEGFL